jgi:hypothetical protein
VNESENLNIRITSRPRGEAPEPIRDAWIGLSLPVARGRTAPIERRIAGVLTGPRGIIGQLFTLLFGGGQAARGWPVDAVTAIEVLQRAQPTAAAWWWQNTPHLFQLGKILMFDEDCCVPEDDVQ